MNQSKKLTDGAVLIAIFIALLLISLFIPVISFFALFFLPVPIIIYASRYDWKPSLLVFLAAILLSSLLPLFFSLPITVFAGLGGIMIGSAIHKKLSAYETWARGTVGFLVGLLFLFVFSQFVFQINWVNEIEQMMTESMQMSQEFMKQLGFAGQSEAAIDLLKERMGMLTTLLPAGLAVIAILFAFISQWISYKMINRLENKKLGFPSFRNLRMPVTLIWIYFISLIVTFFGLDPSGTLYLAVNNVVMLTGLLMTLQGFSFIFYYAYQKNKSKALPIVSVVLSLLLPFIMLYLVRLLGIIDIGFSLRDRISKDKK